MVESKSKLSIVNKLWLDVDNQRNILTYVVSTRLTFLNHDTNSTCCINNLSMNVLKYLTEIFD